MRRTASIIIPVRNGARWLDEQLASIRAQAHDAAQLEVLVIDSGSTDGSVAIARAAGVEVLEIEPASFGHGRTRNLGAERTSGDLICFLTQDATPLPGWLAAYQDAFSLAADVGAAYGPHRPRPDTSPMIARELDEFFAMHATNGGPTVQRAGDAAYLSNVNACYWRDCWAQIRFPEIPYSEDQAFGVAMLEAGWTKVYHPSAAVLHAHDYPPFDFMRRYFDEYRGLCQTIGHVEPFGVRSSARDVSRLVRADHAWMRARGWPVKERTRWALRSGLHHGGRKVFASIGSRGHALPAAVQRRLSLEGTAVSEPSAAPLPALSAPRGIDVPAFAPSPFEPVLVLARDGPATLLGGLPGMAMRESLHIAIVIPPFRRGSGGHNSIFQILSRLERIGHTISIWIEDPLGWQESEWPAVIARNINEWFAPLHAPVFKGFDDWYGADIAVATGWQTVHRVLLLDQCRARAYLVHDHESEFNATSAESYWAEQTYSFGLHHIAASPWLADLMRRRYGGTASLFNFGVDHHVYNPQPVTRRRDTVIFYARDVTPRRAVPLGVLALEELRRRRPDLRIVLFGDLEPLELPFAFEHLGIVSPRQLAWAFSEATAGLCLSMTNYSLIPQEMLACGLPCVDLAGFSSETVFGKDGPVELAAFDPVDLADALQRLLEEPALWERRSAAGLDFVVGRTWDRAAEQVEAGLREALRRREIEYGAPELAADGHPLRPSQVAPALGPPPGFDASARSVPVRWNRDERLATSRILARLDVDDLAAVDAALDAEQREWLYSVPAPERDRATVALGVWHRVPAVLEKTGLAPTEPPEEVHAMARGPLAAGGAFYEADLIAGVLRAAGHDPADVREALDFGCSSGRVIRALAAAWPETEWHGCDPNRAAIMWAEEHVPTGRFAVSPTDPPLPYGDAGFDLVFGISIWSHYDESAALRWLDEMHRIVAPGGQLLVTTHGYQSVSLYAHEGLRPPLQLEQIRRSLYRRGFWFAAEFGADGDHGVSHPEWGTAFLTPEWMLRHALPRWRADYFGPGENAGNQDVYVLTRRSRPGDD